MLDEIKEYRIKWNSNQTKEDIYIHVNHETFNKFSYRHLRWYSGISINPNYRELFGKLTVASAIAIDVHFSSWDWLGKRKGYCFSKAKNITYEEFLTYSSNTLFAVVICDVTDKSNQPFAFINVKWRLVKQITEKLNMDYRVPFFSVFPMSCAQPISDEYLVYLKLSNMK